MDPKKCSTSLILSRLVHLNFKLKHENSLLHNFNLKLETINRRKTFLETKSHIIEREVNELHYTPFTLAQIEKKKHSCIARKQILEKNICSEKKLLCAKKVLGF